MRQGRQADVAAEVGVQCVGIGRTRRAAEQGAQDFPAAVVVDQHFEIVGGEF